jgi:hypothetical protein
MKNKNEKVPWFPVPEPVEGEPDEELPKAKNAVCASTSAYDSRKT